jgi:hypothetical protein
MCTSISSVGELSLVLLVFFLILGLFFSLGFGLSLFLQSFLCLNLGSLLLGDFFTLARVLSFFFRSSSCGGSLSFSFVSFLFSIHLLLGFFGSDRSFFLHINLSQLEVLGETLFKLLSRPLLICKQVRLSAEEPEQVIEKVVNSLTLLYGSHEHAVQSLIV